MDPNEGSRKQTSGQGQAQRWGKGAEKSAGKKAATPPVVETVVVDVVAEPVPGVMVVTEIEATEVHEAGAGPEEPEQSRSAPRGVRRTIRLS